MKKLLLASLLVSVMGFSSLFAEEKKEKKVEAVAACGCPHAETEVKEQAPAEEEEVKVSAVEEEDVTIKAVSCGDCDKGDNLADDEEEFSIG